MKVRFLATAVAALLMIGSVGCDKKEESSSAPAAAPAAEEKKDEAAEEKKDEAAEEKKDEAAPEAKADAGAAPEAKAADAGAAPEAKVADAGAAPEAKAADAGAAPEAKAADAGAQAAAAGDTLSAEELAKRRLEVLKKYEYTLEGYVQDMAKFKDAAAEQAKEACMPQMSEEDKQKVVNLAIDLGCLRKKEQDAQKMIQIEADLYAGSGMDQAAYLTKLNEIKGKDQEVEGRINAAISECPTFEDIQRSRVVGILVQNKCLRQANLKPARLGELQKDILENFEMTGAEYGALRTKFLSDPGFKEAIEEGTKNCPPLAEADIVTEEEAKKKAAAPIGGTYSGKVFGSAGGQITLTVSGNKKGLSGSAQVGGQSFKLNGYTLAGRKMTAQGANGKDFVRVYGKFGGSNQTLTGSWTGVLGGKKRGGSVSMARR
jgi:hypothetical protein